MTWYTFFMSVKTILVIIGVLLGAFLIWNILDRDTGVITNYPPARDVVVSFGDSLVEGVGATSGNDFSSILEDRLGVPIINRGIRGNTTADGLARIDDVLRRDTPGVVILLLGGNDAIRRVSVEETFKNLSTIIEKIHARGAVTLLVGVQGGILGDKYKGEFRDLRKRYQTAFVPDILDGLIGTPGLMYDGVHPNDEGYRVIADRLEPVLRELLLESRE